jgi:type IV pilus assembly protein PilV
MTSHRPPRRATQGGFSLIEGLVSILIFSLGILALVGLQANSMQMSSSAKYRSDASLLANALIGQMWVTDRTVTTLQNNFNTGQPNYATWLSDVQATLPVSAASAPTVAVSASGVVTVNIYWKAPNEQVSAPAHQYTAIAQVK